MKDLFKDRKKDLYLYKNYTNDRAISNDLYLDLYIYKKTIYRLKITRKIYISQNALLNLIVKLKG